MKTSKVLKLAKTQLHVVYVNYPRHNLYICWVLEDLCNAKRISAYDSQRVRGILSKLLDNKVTLEHWLRVTKRIPVPQNCWLKPEVRQKLYVTRQAWLDHLIEYYQAQGD